MKPILVDSSFLPDIFTGDPEWSADALVSWSASHELSINDVVAAEVSVGFNRIEDLREALGGLGVEHISMPLEALFLAGKVFVAYRRRGGKRVQPLTDFFIGAHAAVSRLVLLTRDPTRVFAMRYLLQPEGCRAILRMGGPMRLDLTNATWLNRPAAATVTAGRVSITTDPGSDFWQRTYYGFRNDNAHALLAEIAENFTLTVRVRFEYRNRFDQCGLAIYESDSSWFKASIEFENDEFSRLGSVVTNDGYSDWATVDIETFSEVWYRLSRRGPDFLIERAFAPVGAATSHRLDFRQMRIFHLASLGETTPEMGRSNPPLPATMPVHAGIYACSPLEGSFTAVFDSFEMGACVWEAHL